MKLVKIGWRVALGLSVAACFGGGGPGEGEFIDIESYVQGRTAIDAESLRTSNQGVYFSGIPDSSGSGAGEWVWRLDIAAGSPEWYVHKHDTFLRGFSPSKEINEQRGEFAIFFHTLEKFGYVGINTGTPALLEEPYPAGADAPNVMVVDRSPSANMWALYNAPNSVVVKMKSRIQSEGFVTIDTVPAPSPSFIAEPDDDDAFIYVLTGTTLYQVSSPGDVESLDLGPLAELSALDRPKKIRVVDNVVWVQIGRNIYRVNSMTDASLFEQLQGSAAMTGGGSFAVDSQFLYTTDGTKKDTRLETETNFLTGVDLNVSTAFQSSMQIEGANDALDGYLYSIGSSGRVVKVKK